jgi:hypothetical protein
MSETFTCANFGRTPSADWLEHMESVWGGMVWGGVPPIPRNCEICSQLDAPARAAVAAAFADQRMAIWQDAHPHVVPLCAADGTWGLWRSGSTHHESYPTRRGALAAAMAASREEAQG